ncbi:MAG: TusE/DsrC/DsvC family sulfur relay protein [Gallionella sp.]
MLNINNTMNYQDHLRADPDGNMFDLDHWSPLKVRQMATQEGIGELTDAHWHVIYLLRNLFRDKGQAGNTREAMRMLEQDFVDEGGSRYLYELFPRGPINQGSRLAGVPAPPHASDPSFGWSA